jgi:hypothetical protein
VQSEDLTLWRCSNYYKATYWEEALKFDYEEYGEIDPAYWGAKMQNATNARIAAEEKANAKETQCSRLCIDWM